MCHQPCHCPASKLNLDLFAGTPPLEATKLAFSHAVTDDIGELIESLEIQTKFEFNLELDRKRGQRVIVGNPANGYSKMVPLP